MTVTPDLETTESSTVPKPVNETLGASVTPGRDIQRWWLAAGAVVAAWALPVVANALSVDWILPPLLVLAVASLLRAGRTIVDRIMISLALLLGATPPLGLLISVWPFGLNPVPVAGFAFTGLVAIAVLLRRVPRIPLRFRGSDLVVVGTWVMTGVVAFWPFWGRDKLGRFSVVAAGGDLASHFSLYDAIRGVGGYAFLHQAATARMLESEFRTYPQGLHFVTALLASFMRSDGHQAASAMSELNTFVWFAPATYVFMCMAVVWALRWVAGPSLRLWTALPIVVLGMSYLVFQDPITIYWTGFFPELVALGEFAILLAVLARPLPRTREQIVLVAALLVAISWTYFLMLPIVGVSTLVWLYFYRRRLRRHLRLLVGVGLVGVAAAGVMVYVNLFASPAGNRLITHGAIMEPDKRQFYAISLLGLGCVIGAARRSPVWRAYLVSAAVTVLFIVAVRQYLIHKLGFIEYWYFKSTHLAMIVFVIGLGAAGRVLSQVTGPAHARRRVGIRPAATAVAVSVSLTLAAVSFLGPLFGPNYGREYMEGASNLYWPWPAQAAWAVAHAAPQGTGEVTVVRAGRGIPAQATHWSSVLLRDQGVAERFTYDISDSIPMEQLLSTAPAKVRLVTDNPAVVKDVNDVLTRRPDLAGKVEILRIPLPK